MASCPLLSGFRAQTSALHEALHVHPALAHLTQPSLTKDYYRDCLRLFHGFYAPLEQLYAQSEIEGLEEFAPLTTLHHLEHDLKREGVSPESVPVSKPGSFAAPEEFALAYLYLREGSGLGGKMISRHLQSHLGLEPGSGNAFFWGHGENTGRLWRLYQERLAAMAPEIDNDLATNYAVRLFESLNEWLSAESEMVR